MKISPRMIALLCMAMTSIAAAQPAQQAGYTDAKNLKEAIDAMSTSIITTDAMLQECSQRFPGSKHVWDADLASWKLSEATVTKKMEAITALTKKALPAEMADFESKMRIAVKARFETMEKMNPAAALSVEMELCHDHFSELASGVWRKRTPNVYALLEQAPDVPLSENAVAAMQAAAQHDTHMNQTPSAGSGGPSVQATYSDAVNPQQAVGMMIATFYLSPLLLNECAARFPEQKESMEANLDAWKHKENPAIAAAQRFWERITRGHDAEVKEMRSQWKTGMTQTIETIRTMDPDGSHGTMASYCRGFFGDLGSDVARTRTPKAYAFLDAMAESSHPSSHRK